MQSEHKTMLVYEQEEMNLSGPEASPEQKVNILLVDDHPGNLLALESALSFLDQNLVKASSGKEALKMLLKDDFAVILLDVHMPDMDGFETASLIRDREKSENIPIIFLTAMHKTNRQVFRGYSLGAVDYIFKPFEPEILKAKVGVFIELYKKTQEVKRQAELLREKNRELDGTNKAILSLYKEIEKKNDELEVRVEERTAQLAKANEALQAEIVERERAEQQRIELLAREKEARAQAEAANRAKDEFLATVSHELRTPLNAVLGWVRLLGTGKLDEAGSARALETIERNAKSQAKLIEDILDVSRVITGKMRLEIRPAEVVPIIEAAIDVVRPAAEAKAIRLRTELDHTVGEIHCDPNRLQQIVWNLLSNGVKFTPPGGQIDVRLAAEDAYAQITVSDTGNGITKEFLPYVFDRFRQAESTTTRVYGGLGLGLAIVRHLVEMHGGTIQADSAGEGKGATFIVRLPIIAASGREISPPTSPVDESAGAGNGPADYDPMILDQVRVLVVDDDPDTLKMLTLVLAQCGAEVRPAASAVEALSEIERWVPHLLISDISMPAEDGYSLISKVRGLGSLQAQRIPAIALTAFASSADQKRALSAGFQMHIAKPIEPSELILAIATLAERQVYPSS